ncbi:MAG TPA: hypothetical protein VE621_06955 [Bryobacteraceae bacterium]|nr:hypothetical protein [Bryobacteraceae bacterium]
MQIVLGHERGVVLARMFLGFTACLAALFSQQLYSQVQPVGKPESNWLYIIDSNKNREQSQILVLDPEQGLIRKVFKTGHQPDLAVSSDGKKLFVAHNLPSPEGGSSSGVLEVVDSVTGLVLSRVENPDRWLTPASFYTSKMALSHDGRWLFIFKMHATQQDSTFYVSTFDTEAGTFLPERVALPGCVSGVLLPMTQREHLAVICSETRDVRFLTLNQAGGKSEAVMPPSFIADAREHGRFVGTGEWSGTQAPVVSPDRRTLYLGVGKLDSLTTGRPRLSQVVALRSDTYERVGAVATAPFSSLAISKDGARIYTIEHDTASVSVIDARQLKALTTIDGIGVTPTFAVLAP